MLPRKPPFLIASVLAAIAVLAAVGMSPRGRAIQAETGPAAGREGPGTERTLPRVPGRLGSAIFETPEKAAVVVRDRRTGRVVLSTASETLEGADLHGRHLWGADLGKAKLAGANLEGAQLSDADLEKADLRRANLRGASMVRARLVGACLQGADLSGASLWGASVEGADLRDATLTDANLLGCVYDAATRWPDGFDPKAHPVVPATLLGKDPVAPGLLDRRIDLRLQNADLRAAAAALRKAGVIVAPVHKTLKTGRASLTLRDTPARQVLDTVAALYGVTWRGDTAVQFQRKWAERPIDLTLKDADLTAAVAALQQAGIFQPELRGEAPERRISLSLRSVPARQAVEVIAAAYGVAGRCQQSGPVFTALAAVQADADEGLSEERAQQINMAINMLRQLGIADRYDGRSDPTASAEAIRRVVASLAPAERGQPQGAGEGGATVPGVPIRDLPPATRRIVLQWQRSEHARQREASLRSIERMLVRATEPFDEERCLASAISLRQEGSRWQVDLNSPGWRRGYSYTATAPAPLPSPNETGGNQ
ncbi:MAG: pentapeptide repeat-containing protein [Armatimonadetes bacterium]|nr:pentapeptide repeat-containing protein [Armatimonadota bacterium]